METYDVIVVGSGPAGMATVYTLIENNANMKIAIFEKGADREYNCSDIMEGWGGCGTFSDGKIHCNTVVGGQLHLSVDRDILQQYVDDVDEMFVKFGAPNDPSRYFREEKQDDKILQSIISANLQLIPTAIHHIGTENAYGVISNIKEYFIENGVDIYCDSFVESFTKQEPDGFKVVSNGKEYLCKHLVIAVGRGGASWLAELLDPMGIEYSPGSCDIGVDPDQK